jgi:DNA-binding transcriptional ArsR family regulator
LSFEEDTYSSIYTALKHPIRRRILRMLGQSPVIYTDILNQLNIDNGLLNYHLDNMKELITKDKEGRYILSEFGKAALSLTTKVEEPVSKQGDRIFGLNTIQIKSVLAILVIFLGVFTVLYVDLNNRYTGIETQYSSRARAYEELNEKYTNLMEEYLRIEDRLKYYELWNGEPEIADPYFLPPKGEQAKRADLGVYVAVSSKLGAIINQPEYEMLKEVIVYHYPDWNNGTAYVALSDTSPEITNMILGLFSPYIQDKIRFVNAPAPLNKIEEWRKALWGCKDYLEERGIKPTYTTMYYNGKILLGIEEITTNTISFLKEAIKEKVPPGVIVLEETGPIELNGFTQEA